MQLFKDKQLRREFEEFKNEYSDFKPEVAVLKDIVTNESSLITKDLQKLQKENKELKRQIKAIEAKLESIQDTSSDPVEVKKETPKRVQYCGKLIYSKHCIEYKTLLFDGFNFTTSTGRNAGEVLFTAHQIQYLMSLTNITNWTSLAKELGLSDRTVQKLCYNILEGNFKKHMNEYHSLKVSYKKGICFINKQRTGLTVKDVKTIIECYVNDKSEETINKLCKSYPGISNQYIVSICDNYKAVPVKTELKQQTYVNNPQKRKEKGMC